MRRIACFWWKGTDNVSVTVIAFALKKGSLEVDMVERKMMVGAELTCEPEEKFLCEELLPSSGGC